MPDYYNLDTVHGIEQLTIADGTEKVFDLDENFKVNWKLLHTEEVEANTSSTTAADLKTIKVPGTWDKNKILFVTIRDKAGKRKGYFYGSDNYAENYRAANDDTSATPTVIRCVWAYSNSELFTMNGSGYGVYLGGVDVDGNLSIKVRYHSTYSMTINGTYVISVYMLDYPDDTNPFA